jgi:hypothetical protein
MAMPEKIKDFGWFGAGWALFKGGTDDPDYYPPLNDMEAQRQWLGGFGAAWVECPDGDGMGGESVDQALASMLEDRPELLRQLRSHATGRTNRTRH